MISEEIKRHILDNTDIVREIGKFISLKRYGQSYRASCPFHTDQTRSFFINPNKNIFKCFGCGRSGDIIAFVEGHEFMTDTEAVEYLASEAGITLSPGSGKEEKLEKKENQIIGREESPPIIPPLYGLPENSSAIREAKKVIIVQDYHDVAAFSQKGVRNVVSLDGAALNGHQAKELSALTGSCVLCVDEDEDNLPDIQSTVTCLFYEGLFVKIADLSDGKGPAEALGQARSAIDFLCDRFISAASDPDDSEWLESMVNTLCKIVSQFPADRQPAIEGYLKKIEKKLGISKDILASTLKQITSTSPPAADVQPERKKVRESKTEKDSEEINAIISPRNLLLAWRKIRHFAKASEVYFDSKLFEQFEKRADEYLFVLHHRLKKQLDNNESSYKPKPFRSLRLTKPQGGVRDVTVSTSIEDQIVIQAILNVVAPVMEKTFSSNSFGHRLSDNFSNSELIFERWQDLYGSYQAKLRQFLLAPASCYYLKTDLTAFYDRIKRKRLCDSIIQYVQHEWTILTIENFINYRLLRDNGITTESELDGLPQGPAYGHFFANLYLADFDRFVEKTLAIEQKIALREASLDFDEKYVSQVTYCRYVDDIFILFNSEEEAAKCKEIFANELDRIGLSLSEEKTKISPVTDHQLIVDEMKSKKYTLGKLLDNDKDLNLQQREKLYEVVETDFLKIHESAEMPELAGSITFLLSHLTDTEYFTQNKDDLINLVIELLFSESFKHSAIGGVLKRTLPQMEIPWARRFAGYLQSRDTPDFKRVLFLQSVEENNFYDSLKPQLQECIREFLGSPNDFIRFAAVNCLWANNVVWDPQRVMQLVKKEKNQQIQARLLHLADKERAGRTFPAFLGIQARQNAAKSYHALLVAQASLSDASQKVINGCCLGGDDGPVLVELLYAILRDGSREAVERLEKIYDDKELRPVVSELLKIILSHTYQLYEEGFIDTRSIVELSHNLQHLKTERVKSAIMQGLIKPLVARIDEKEPDAELREEFRAVEEKLAATTNNPAHNLIIEVIAKESEPTDVGFLNDLGVSYQAYRHLQEETLDIFETVDEQYVIRSGGFKDIYEWEEFIKEARNNDLVWYSKIEIPDSPAGKHKALIHYHLDSSRIRVCDLLLIRQVGELELASFMKIIAETSRRLTSHSRRYPAISPYNIIVDASLKPHFINLGTAFCNPRYLSTSMANHRDFSPSHDSLFLGWLSFEMLTGTCPLTEIKHLTFTDGKKFLTTSPKLATASLFYTRILRRLTYIREDYRKPLRESRRLFTGYMEDIQDLQKYENQDGTDGKNMLRSLLMSWRRRISDVWSDRNLDHQGNAMRIIWTYSQLMEETITNQEVKKIHFMDSFEIEESLRAGMHAGSAFLDGLLDQVERLQNQCEEDPSLVTDRRINLVIMYLALRVELMACAQMVRAKYFLRWSQTPLIKEFINTSNKAKFLASQLELAARMEIKSRWWQSRLESLSTDITFMAGKEAQYDLFAKTEISGLYAFVCLCTDEKERGPDIRNELKLVSEWDKKVTACLRNKKMLTESVYAKYKNQYRTIINNLIGRPKHRIRARFKDNLMHWATKTVRVIPDDAGGELDVKITDMICVSGNVFEKQRVKDEIATCDLIDGKVVTLSSFGYYEKKLCQARKEPVQVHEKVYIHSPTDISNASELNHTGGTSVELVKHSDGWHWIVNLEDKGLVSNRENSIIYKISRILFDQTGCGWTPHRTFYQAAGWSEEEYFGEKDTTGRMQKQLSRLRGILGIEIQFRIDKGVRFPENIVKSK